MTIEKFVQWKINMKYCYSCVNCVRFPNSVGIVPYRSWLLRSLFKKEEEK